MKPATSELLKSLEDADWFAHVGEPTDDVPGLARVGSWDEALRACTSEAWNDFRLDVQNQITMQIWQASLERWDQWPAVEEVVQRRIWDMVQRKAAHVQVADDEQRMAFYGSIWRDIGLAAIEVEHADLVEPGVAGLLAEVYRLGHFPCGDEEGTGRLVVY
jgi:hypothetical protein